MSSDQTDEKQQLATMRNNLKTLIVEKDALELKVRTTRAAMLDPKATLIDQDGFPRADIDVYGERVSRNQLVRLQNDHKAKMGEIERALHALHALQKKVKAQPHTTATATAAVTASSTPRSGLESKRPMQVSPVPVSSSVQIQEEPALLEPFFKVTSVAEGSPAQLDGVRVNDHISRLGSLTAANVSPEAFKALIIASENSAVEVTVFRDLVGILTLQLTPRQWAGRGLVGCGFAPL